MQGKRLLLFSVLLGFTSYTIFFVGILGELTFVPLALISVISVSFVLLLGLRRQYAKRLIQFTRNNRLMYVFIPLIITNLIGALGPELGFDALWYHLTIPKVFIANERIEFIPGSLLYYSVMPKLVDLLYIPILFFFNETFVKLSSLLLGLMTTYVTYRTARLFVNQKLSIFAAVIFYSNLVVSWLSITAYVDLGRAFFASLAVYFLLLFIGKRKNTLLVASGLLVGFEIATKLLGFGTLLAFIGILFFLDSKAREKVKNISVILVTSLAVVTPWLILSYASTGNMFYPFFSDVYPSFTEVAINPLAHMESIIRLFLFSADPISPIYVLVIPLLFYTLKSFNSRGKFLVILFFIVLVLWALTPQKNARFMVPYLPALSVIVVYTYSKLTSPYIKKVIIVFSAFVIALSFMYRLVANAKYIPYIVGYNTKEEFLMGNLNFSFGDYYDRADTVKSIVGEETVLIYDIHNLYYVDFSYDHESWAKDHPYQYVLSRGKRVMDGYHLIHKDAYTDTYLYEKN